MLKPQAKGVKRMLDSEPDETREALDTIVDSGERALREMRRLLRMLRRSDDEIAMAPLPSLRHSTCSPSRSRAPACPSSCALRARRRHCPRVDLSAYRIVQ